MLSFSHPSYARNRLLWKAAALCWLWVGGHALQAAENTPATILLISSEELAEAWKPFATWKTQNGKPTRIVSLKEIEKTYAGKDLQEKIRACCLHHIEKSSTRWVILGGDSGPRNSGRVPDRDTPHPEMGREYSDLPSDLYFISVSDWDANDDGVYGEWKNDRDAVSYTHEGVSLGRIPVRTAEDVKAYTEKVVAFESKSGPGLKAPGKMVYTCPIVAAYRKLGTSKGIVSAKLPAGAVSDYFAHGTPWDKSFPGDHELSTGNWISLINSGEVSMMHMHGHGLIQNWVLEGRNVVDLEHVAKLNNADSPLFMTTVSCFTGQFDNREDPSIAEAMLRHPGGGALVVVAPSREGMPIFHNPARDIPLMVREGKMDGTTKTMTLFWKYALEEDQSVGEAFAKVKSDLTPDAKRTPGFHFIQCELNLLGDPTLVLNPGKPTDTSRAP